MQSLRKEGFWTYLDLQNCQNNGPYTAYSLYFGILGHHYGLFWRCRYWCSLSVTLKLFATPGQNPNLIPPILNSMLAPRAPEGLWSLRVPGPPKEPKIMALYPKIESIGSIGSIILAILEAQVSSEH